MLVIARLYLGREADRAGADELRPVDPAGFQLIDSDPVPILRQFIQGLDRVAAKNHCG